MLLYWCCVEVLPDVGLGAVKAGAAGGGGGVGGGRSLSHIESRKVALNAKLYLSLASDTS